MAQKALAFLLERAYKHGRLFRTVTGGVGKLNAYLDDYAFLAAALIDAFEATAKPAYLDKARELTAVMVEQFWDPQTSGCFFTGKDRSEEHTSELQSRLHLVCRLLLEKKKQERTTVPDLNRCGKITPPSD